jgi:hypothetical protein
MMIWIVGLTDLMHERSRDIYKIQGEVQQEGSPAQYNSPGRGNFNPRGGFHRKRKRRRYGSRSRTDNLL